MTTELINGQLPSDWELVEIGQKFTFTTKPKGLNFEDREIIPFAPMERIPSDRLYFSDFVLKAPQEISSGTYFEDGDLLLSKITPCFENGKQGIATRIPKGFGIATTEVIPIKAIEGVSYLPFLAMYLLDRGVRNSLAGKMEGATGRQRLAKSVLKGWIMPFPPLPEQRAIAAVLSKIQAVMEVQGKIIATLKELKAATMAKLFREGLRSEPLKQTEIGEVPESWEVVSLGNVAQEIFGGGTPSTKQPEYWGGDIHWTTSAYISGIYLREGQRQITRRGLVNSASSLVPAGNLLIGTRVGVGKVSVNLIDIAISQDLTALVVKKDRYNPEFLAFALLTDRCQNIFELQKRGATIKGIPRDDLLQIHLAVPGLPEQQEIARKLLALHDKIEITVRKRDTLKFLFSSMLHLLMTGQIRVKLSEEVLD